MESASGELYERPVLFLARRRALAAAINFETQIAAGRHAACGFFVATSG
jgi:hypothetical protein